MPPRWCAQTASRSGFALALVPLWIDRLWIACQSEEAAQSDGRLSGRLEVNSLHTLCEANAEKDTSQQRKLPDFSTYPNFSRHKRDAILPKYLTPNLYEQLKNLQTSRGVTLDDIIRAGTTLPWGADPPRGVGGVYVGDAECYTVFAPLLHPLIAERHRTWRSTTTSKPNNNEPSHLTLLDPEKIDSDRNIDPTGEHLLSTRMRVARSIEGISFPPSMDRAERRQVEQLFKECVKEDFGGGKYVPVMDMTNTQHDDLVRRGILFESPEEFRMASGFGRDWPDARGIYCRYFRNPSSNNGTEVVSDDDSNSNDDDWSREIPHVIIWCNYDDHFRIISMAKGGDVRTVFTRLSQIVQQLETSLSKRGYSFCWHPQYGFLNSSPANIGTTLRASMTVKLVRLGRHPLFPEIIRSLRLETRDLYNRRARGYTGIFDIANAERLGKTEVELINLMIHGVAQLILLEKQLERGEEIQMQDLITQNKH